MPKKSRHGKGRRPQYRNNIRQQQGASQAIQNAVAAPGTPAPAAAKIPAPSKGQSGSTAATAAQYPYFTSELKKIGIISGIIIIILVILAVVLT